MDRNVKGQFIKGHKLTPFGHKRTRGRKHTKEAINKIITSKVGKKRKSFTFKTRENMSNALHRSHKKFNFGFQAGNKNFNWRGGQSAIYGPGFTSFLKPKIKDRDGRMCQLCKTYKNLAIHHIDYDKMNCVKNNLITLCRSCNTKVNFNREKWQKLFKKKILGVSL